MREIFVIAYLITGVVCAVLTAYHYWIADLPRAVFWLLFMVACDVAIIRREASK